MFVAFLRCLLLIILILTINKHAGDSAPAASSFKQLSFLDRFLAIWIFLAMAIGIILGYFVPETSPALQRGKFVDVSIPIGT